MLNGSWRLGYRPALDGIRAIAILLVIGQHAVVPGFRNAGYVGVTLFFVLSGFLITRLLIEERRETGRIRLREFYVRRARRLFPALAALLLVVGVFMVIIGKAEMIAGDTIPVVFYVANWVHATSEPLGLLGHAWSLAIEEQFYLLWPVAFIAFAPRMSARRLLVWLAVAALLSAAARGLVAPTLGPQAAARVTFAQADGLLAGCAMAVLFEIRPWRPGLRFIALASMLLAGSVAAIDEWIFLFVGIPATVAAGVILAAYGATHHGGLLAARPLVALGMISYGLYLWHAPLLRIGRDAGWVPGPAAIVLVLASLAFALLSWRYVETPFRKRRRRQAAGNPRAVEPRNRPAEATISP